MDVTDLRVRANHELADLGPDRPTLANSKCGERNAAVPSCCSRGRRIGMPRCSSVRPWESRREWTNRRASELLMDAAQECGHR
jgi:hypothetical protein